jgi:peroxiredoxin Q/BCP
MLKLKTKAPDFSLEDQHGKTHTLKAYRGKKVLIYFYPKDDTPGCTTEACSFRDNYKELSKLGLIILGISKDTVKSHKKFAEKYDLPFPLLADVDTTVCQAYEVWAKKKFMGREYMGILRTSFLIDEEGKIAKIYEDVKPAEHVGEIRESVSA